MHFRCSLRSSAGRFSKMEVLTQAQSQGMPACLYLKFKVEHLSYGSVLGWALVDRLEALRTRPCWCGGSRANRENRSPGLSRYAGACRCHRPPIWRCSPQRQCVLVPCTDHTLGTGFPGGGVPITLSRVLSCELAAGNTFGPGIGWDATAPTTVCIRFLSVSPFLQTFEN